MEMREINRQTLQRALGQLPESDPPTRVWQALEQELDQRKKIRRIPPSAWLLAACLGILLTGFSLRMGGIVGNGLPNNSGLDSLMEEKRIKDSAFWPAPLPADSMNDSSTATLNSRPQESP